MTFSRAHFSTLIKYIGVSFITGSISHGFFSESRAIFTGIFGVIFFLIGSFLEEWIDLKHSWNIIIAWTLLSVGIGAVTGGLQHFPDSPERSVWIIPIGYIVSLFFFAFIHEYKLTKKEYTYIAVSAIFMTLLSISLFSLLEYTSILGTHTEQSETAGHHD